MSSTYAYGVFTEDLPDPPENPEFNELFTDAEQDVITRRFEAGIARNERALYDARKRHTEALAAQRTRSDARKAERERYLARRFNPVLRSRP